MKAKNILAILISSITFTVSSISYSTLPSAVCVSTESTVLNENLNDSKAFDYAKRLLSEFYLSVDQYADFNISKYCTSTELSSYITNKVIASQYKSIAYGADDITNYALSFTLLRENEYDGLIYLDVLSDVSYNYKGSTCDSAYGEESNFILKEYGESYVLLDWFMPYDLYDTTIRGDISDTPSLYSNPSSAIDIDILDKQTLINEQIKDYYKRLCETNQVTSANEPSIIDNNNINTTAVTSLHNLNKSNISTWALNNYNLTTPSSGNSSLVSSYYDFSTISGNYDCTNFVSHAILAGGTVLYDTGNTGISSSGWYFRNISNRSSSWSGVSNLYNFLTNNSNRGPCATELSYSHIYAPSGNFPYTYGDIMQFHNGSIWRHSAVITSYVYLNGSSTTLEAAVTYRSSYTSYAKNKRQSEVYAGYNRRVLKLNGYYS